MRLRTVWAVVSMLFVAALVGKPVLGQLIDRTTAPNTANEGIAKSLRGPDRCGTRRRHHAGLVAVHHQSRSCARHPAGPPDLPAQVHPRAGPGPADGRRRGRHRGRPDHRRRPAGQLRRLPRPARGSRRLRRRRRHAARQPRRAAPLRPGTEGDAGRRDHRRPAGHPPPGDRRRPGAVPQNRHPQPRVEQGRSSTTADHRRPERHRRHVARGGRRSRPAGPAVLPARRNDLHPRVRWSARSTPRWGSKRPTRTSSPLAPATE